MPHKRVRVPYNRPAVGSEGEETLILHLRVSGLPEPIRELVFAPPRKYRFDLAWPDLKIACEVDGGTWISGRHNRGSSIAKDYEKLNLAVVNGWRVLRFTTDQVKSGEAAAVLSIMLLRKEI